MGDVEELQRKLPQRHVCKDCEKWYGQEDDEYGPCAYKHMRGEEKHITYGFHECDEVVELRLRVERWRAHSASAR